MEPILAFTAVMLVWTIGEFISIKTKALISMMLVASFIFLIGFGMDFFPIVPRYQQIFMEFGWKGIR